MSRGILLRKNDWFLHIFTEKPDRSSHRWRERSYCTSVTLCQGTWATADAVITLGEVILTPGPISIHPSIPSIPPTQSNHPPTLVAPPSSRYKLCPQGVLSVMSTYPRVPSAWLSIRLQFCLRVRRRWLFPRFSGLTKVSAVLFMSA